MANIILAIEQKVAPVGTQSVFLHPFGNSAIGAAENTEWGLQGKARAAPLNLPPQERFEFGAQIFLLLSQLRVCLRFPEGRDRHLMETVGNLCPVSL